MKRRKVEKSQKNDDCTIIIDDNSKRDRSGKSKDKREKSNWEDSDGRKEKRVRSSKRAVWARRQMAEVFIEKWFVNNIGNKDDLHIIFFCM